MISKFHLFLCISVYYIFIFRYNILFGYFFIFAFRAAIWPRLSDDVASQIA